MHHHRLYLWTNIYQPCRFSCAQCHATTWFERKIQKNQFVTSSSILCCTTNVNVPTATWSCSHSLFPACSLCGVPELQLTRVWRWREALMRSFSWNSLKVCWFYSRLRVPSGAHQKLILNQHVSIDHVGQRVWKHPPHVQRYVSVCTRSPAVI